jgi:hypothetical protein
LRKAVHSWAEKRGKYFADDEEFETEMRKWLRQQSKDFYAVGFDALVKRWNMCISVSGGYGEKLTKLRGRSPQANYTDRSTAASRRK